MMPITFPSSVISGPPESPPIRGTVGLDDAFFRFQDASESDDRRPPFLPTARMTGRDAPLAGNDIVFGSRFEVGVFALGDDFRHSGVRGGKDTQGHPPSRLPVREDDDAGLVRLAANVPRRKDESLFINDDSTAAGRPDLQAHGAFNKRGRDFLQFRFDRTKLFKRLLTVSVIGRCDNADGKDYSPTQCERQ